MKSKVMIIEDNKILSDMYKFKFSLEGYDVLVENESENAIKEFEKFKPDIIVLDLMMPNVNGFEILEKIRLELKSDCKILILSNLSEQKERDRAMDLGADKFILKSSIAPKDLVNEIKNILK